MVDESQGTYRPRRARRRVRPARRGGRRLADGFRRRPVGRRRRLPPGRVEPSSTRRPRNRCTATRSPRWCPAGAESVDETRVRQAPKAGDTDLDAAGATRSRRRSSAGPGLGPERTPTNRSANRATRTRRPSCPGRPRAPGSSAADARGDGGDREDDELRDDADDRPEGQRRRLGLLIAAVAAVVVLGLGIGYTVFSLTRESAAPGVAPARPPTPTRTNDGSTAPPEPDPMRCSPTLPC